MTADFWCKQSDCFRVKFSLKQYWTNLPGGFDHLRTIMQFLNQTIYLQISLCLTLAALWLAKL